MINKIEYFYHRILDKYHDIRGFFRYGIPNLFAYFKIIVNDRDWDHTYFYELIQLKLSRMSKRIEYLQKNDCAFEGSDLQIKRINFCIRCIDRLIREEYRQNIYNDIMDKYERNIGIKWLETWNEWQDKLEKNPELKNEYYNDLRNLWDMQEADFLRDKRLLFRVLEKYLHDWWD